MGIINRVKNALSSKTNSKLDDLENPIKLLNEKIRSMDENLNNAQIYAAPVLGNVKKLKFNIKKAEEERENYNREVKLAVKKGNDDLAKKALEKKIQKDKEIATLKETLVNTEQSAQRLKDNLYKLQQEIDKIINYRDEASSRYNNAKIAEKINEVIADVKTKKSDISLEDIEKEVAKIESQALGIHDLGNMKENTLDSELNQKDVNDESK